ncbi:hydrogenase nickel incorporation protein HypB [Aquabacter sp. L1I39]|uniref:hydrogenase nickel incorporation protein HypB n=1 Tax=Aquabacter sp. L1I39 TaxID=2820278 RepID=UPI001AD95E26|nr:hydrogenase nickel incorporation protein HypB [Aquabacter sp. L1I39]QTL04656.1 hydrogenase nickel incorporation protein HypB [Aquabacter sp. L1I39]
MCVTCGCGTDAAILSGPWGEAKHEHEAQGQGQGHSHAHDAHGAHHHHHGDHDHEHHHGHGHDHGQAHGHDHSHDHGHPHTAPAAAPRLLELEQDILAKNDRFAARNRARLTDGGVLALNILAGPGAGKTTLLVETLKALAGRYQCAVIEGDQQTSNDADRIRAVGVPAVQVNTGKGCHLDAHMVGHAMERLPLPAGGVLFIENVGNLVCPAAFDLGEAKRATLLSVTEGEDKPLKYPDIFETADVVLLTKADLLPHLDVSEELLRANVARINPKAQILTVSSRGGPGLAPWLAWLATARAARLDALAASAQARAEALRSAIGA